MSYTLPCPLLCFVSCIVPVTLDFQSRYSVTHFARSLQLPSSPPMRRRKATFNTASVCACRFFLRLRLLFLKSCRFFGLRLRRTLYKKGMPPLFFVLQWIIITVIMIWFPIKLRKMLFAEGEENGEKSKKQTLFVLR